MGFFPINRFTNRATNLNLTYTLVAFSIIAEVIPNQDPEVEGDCSLGAGVWDAEYPEGPETDEDGGTAISTRLE